MERQSSQSEVPQTKHSNLQTKLLELGIQANSEQEQKELEEILQDEEFRSLIENSLFQAEQSEQSEPTDITEKYLNGVLESYEKVETLCKNANNLQDDEIENEIKQLDEQEKRMEKQKALVEARIEAVTKEIEDIKALQEDAKNKAEENKQYQKEYLKEITFQIDTFCEQISALSEQTTSSLEAKSTSNSTIQVGILGEFLKKEKELLALALERADKIRIEYASALKQAKPGVQHPGLKDLKYRLYVDEKEKLLLQIAKEKFEFSTKYIKEKIYNEGIIKFDVNSYKKISPEEYQETMKDLDNQIQTLIDKILAIQGGKHANEIDELIKSTDDKYLIKQHYTEQFVVVEEELKAQKERLAAVKEIVLKEQDIVQKDYDQYFEQFEYLQNVFENYKTLNENLNDVFNREINQTSISVRDEYLISLYKLLKTANSQKGRKGEEEDLVILKEHLMDLVQSLKEKDKEYEEELIEESDAIIESLKSMCVNGKEAVELLKSYDILVTPDGEKKNLQKIWSDNLEAVQKGRAELDSYLNKAFQKFQTIVKRRAKDPVTGFTEKDLFVQFMLEKNPRFIQRLRELE